MSRAVVPAQQPHLGNCAQPKCTKLAPAFWPQLKAASQLPPMPLVAASVLLPHSVREPSPPAHSATDSDSSLIQFNTASDTARNCNVASSADNDLMAVALPQASSLSNEQIAALLQAHAENEVYED